MARNFLLGLMMFASTALISGSALADEPSLHQIYQAAEAGKLTEAQTMMQEVLRAHPNSGKAHFVEAELLVKQGQLRKAEAELATAERLAPGLPFAKPEAVQHLRGQLGSSHGAWPFEVQHSQALQQPVHESSVPWGMLLIGVGLIAFILFAVRIMSQRNAMSASGGGLAAGYGSGNASTPLQPYAAGNVGTPGAQGPGMGSRVMGGLATGAAVGVGLVAGEALMHRFMDGKEQHAQSLLPNDLGPSLQDNSFDDMGGADFGVSDTSSWDDSSSSSSDWN